MSLLHIAGGATEDKLDASDVFSAYVRTGTGADVVVTTGIDYTKGFMSWTKGRSGTTDHAIYDSARGVTKDLASNSTDAETTQATGLKAFNTTSHTIGSLAKMNTSGATYVDWVFRKAPKFFDIVTFTGDGTGYRQFSHALASTPGIIVIKSSSGSSSNGSWYVWHRSLGDNNWLLLNTAGAALGAGFLRNANAFTFETSLNTIGTTFVAYLFAHDPSADGIIQCGSWSASLSAVDVNLGWEPQYVLVKNASSTQNWFIWDAMRGMPIDSSQPYLHPNLSAAESSDTYYISPKGDGFTVRANALGSVGNTYIYMAIRRPNKVPTSGTEVYNAIARTGTGATATVTGVGFAPDLVVSRGRENLFSSCYHDRLRGATNYIISNTTGIESALANGLTNFDLMDGIKFGSDTIGYVNQSPFTYINHFFKRAKGFIDIVCYTGTGVARTVNHNLGAVPELMIVKSRSDSDNNWTVFQKDIWTTSRGTLYLNLTNGTLGGSLAWDTTPTSSVFTVGTADATNQTNQTYVAYLFASLQGISKVGSYTGNGTSINLDMGFSTGCRFFLCKRTDSTGDWMIADTVRGITAGADNRLSLNTTAAEVTTDDWVDNYAQGITVNQTATSNANVLNATYIYLGIS